MLPHTSHGLLVRERIDTIFSFGIRVDQVVSERSYMIDQSLDVTKNF